MLFWKEICAFLLLWQCAATANLTHTAGYCNQKHSFVVYKNITQTREVVRKKSVWPFRRTIKDIEYYNETVPHVIWRTVVRCCEGYLMNAEEKCVAHCSPHCAPHADCVAPNHCKCHSGYNEVFEPTGLECVLSTTQEETEATVSSTEFESTTTWESSTDTTFEPTVADCHFFDCPEFAKCSENGTCVCQEGYVWHEQRSQVANEQGMQLDMYCLHENYAMSARDAADSESFSGFLFKVLSILAGVALAVGLSTLLIWRYKQQQSVHINVENGKIADKNGVCKYVSDTEETAVCVVY